MVTAQENLKLADFLFHHRWRCTFDWEVPGVHEDKVCLLAGEERLEDNYKELDMLHKVKKSDMVGRMEVIKECQKSCHGVI